MAVSLGLWVARVLNEAICSVLLFLLCIVSGFKVYEEYVNNQGKSQPRMNRIRTRSVPKDTTTIKSDALASNNATSISVSSAQLSDDENDDNNNHNINETGGSRPSSPGRSTTNSRNRSTSSSRIGSTTNSNNNHKKKKGGLIIVIFAVKIFVVCLSFFMMNVHSLLTLFGVFSCPVRMGPIFWVIGVSTTETIFVDRVASVYRNSKYQYSKITLRTMYTVAIVVNVCFSILWIVFSQSETDRLKGYSEGRVCQVTTDYPIIAALSILSQLVIEFTALKMFTSPLRELSKLGDAMDDHALAMAQLARKSTVLTYFLVFSTILCVTFVVVTGSLMFNPPYLVTYCVTLLLFPHWFDEWYPTLCSIPIWMSDQCCSLPKKVSPKKMINVMRAGSSLSASVAQ